MLGHHIEMVDAVTCSCHHLPDISLVESTGFIHSALVHGSYSVPLRTQNKIKVRCNEILKCNLC